MDDLTESGRFGIFSLLFRATRTKKRNLLIEPFAAAAVNLVSAQSQGKVYVNFAQEFKKELATIIDLDFAYYPGSLTVLIYNMIN